MKLTVAFIVAVVACVTVYDVWTLVFRGYETTLSWVLYQAAKAYPIIPFIFGVLSGHILWENRAAREPTPPA